MTTIVDSNLPVARPSWDHSRLESRIVHLGCGAFHRAHQALYTHHLLESTDSDWGICEVNLMPGNDRVLIENLKKQQLLYTVAEKGYSVWGGSDTIVPIDVWIPGCPPTPAATIHGFAVALGLLQQKIHAVDYRDPTGVTMQPLWPQIPPSQRIAIEREARRLAGYRQGREICDRLLRHLSDDPTGNRVNTWLRDADDPRLNSIVQQLFRVLRGLHD